MKYGWSADLSTFTSITTGALSASAIYKGNVIEFRNLAHNMIQFEFGNLPVHEKIFVRAKVYTTCGSGTDAGISMTLGSNAAVTQTLTSIT